MGRRMLLINDSLIVRAYNSNDCLITHVLAKLFMNIPLFSSDLIYNIQVSLMISIGQI